MRTCDLRYRSIFLKSLDILHFWALKECHFCFYKGMRPLLMNFVIPGPPQNPRNNHPHYPEKF